MSAVQDTKKPKLQKMTTSEEEEVSLPEPMDIEEPQVSGLLQDTAECGLLRSDPGGCQGPRHLLGGELAVTVTVTVTLQTVLVRTNCQKRCNTT